MRKLKLEIDDLLVESFDVLPPRATGVGTVHGHVFNRDWETYDDACQGGGGGVPTVGTCVGPTYCCAPTWKETCPATCYATCPLSCPPPCGTWPEC